MAYAFESDLDACLRSLSSEEKQWLVDRNCGVLLSLRSAVLDYGFLYAALKFWNPETHCFCFHGHEIVPLPEELGAIVGWPIWADVPCLPSAADNFHKEFEKWFGLSSSISRDLLRAKEVDLVSFLKYFLNSDTAGTLYRKRAILFCLFARYLFVHPSLGTGYASVVSIVMQCEQCKNPMPLCVGQLMVSLDWLRQGRYQGLPGGCPLLLQLWLMERLSFIEPPVGRYNPRGILSRRRIYDNPSHLEWERILASRQVNIRWTVAWWNIELMVGTESSPYLRVPSLSVMTFYFPTRVRRQYGQRQGIPDSDTPRPVDKPLSHGGVRSWGEYWGARPRVEVCLLAREDAKVSKHYLAWVNAKTMTERAEARAAEREKRSRGSADTAASISKTRSVKDRLGPKRLPVWGRLEKLS